MKSYGMTQTCRYCWREFYSHDLRAGCSTMCSARLSAYNRQIEKSRWDMAGKSPTLPGMGKNTDQAIANAVLP